MITLGLIHCDKAGTRVDGKTWWVHNASDALFTFLSINPKRGWLGMNDDPESFRNFMESRCMTAGDPYWEILRLPSCYLLRPFTA